MAQLTDRERQVVASLMCGKSQKQIARDLGVSYASVRTYLKRARERTGTNNSIELVTKIMLDARTK